MKVCRWIGFISTTAIMCSSWVRGQDVRSTIRSLVSEVSEERLRTDVQSLAGAGGWRSRMNFTPGNDSALVFIERMFQSLPGIAIARDSFFVPAGAPFNTLPLVNVAAVLPATGSRSDIVVVGAHYDSQAGREPGWDTLWQTMAAPGADDNATGVAAVLEIARLLSARHGSLGSHAEIQFVAFAGEEGTTPRIASYLNGSRHYAAGLRARNANVRAVLNLDMLGFNPNVRFAVIVADSQSQWLGRYVYEKNIEYERGFIIDAPPFRTNRWSDHASFWDQGYPSILMIENYDVVRANPFYSGNTSYHRSSDTAGGVNFQLVKSFTEWALASVCGLAIEEGGLSDARREEISLRLFPNPAGQFVTVQYSMLDAGSIRIVLFDLLGRAVRILQEGQVARGLQQGTFRVGELASGVYVIRVESERGMTVKKVVLLPRN